MKYLGVRKLFHILSHVIVGFLIFPAMAAATPITIDFSQGSSSPVDQFVPQLTYSGLVITGSNDINIVANRNGLGIVGGVFDTRIDSSEWMIFDFTDVATNVYYEPWTYSSDTVQVVEGFDVSGNSLGTVSFNGIIPPHLFDVSDSFGNQLLSGFKLQITEGHFSLKSISYEITTVPEPSTWLLFGFGLLGVISFQYYRRNS
jgi:hypothetical protein